MRRPESPIPTFAAHRISSAIPPCAYSFPLLPKPRANTKPARLTESQNRMRCVRLLERRNLLGRQRQRKSRHGVLEVVRFARANNRSRDKRLAEHPGQRGLCKRNASFFGDLAQAVDNFAVSFFGLRVQGLAKLVGFRSLGGFRLPGTR